MIAQWRLLFSRLFPSTTGSGRLTADASKTASPPPTAAWAELYPRVVGGVAAIGLVAATAFLAAVPGAAQAARPLTRAITDDVWFTQGSHWSPWIQRTAASGARVALIEVDWESIEPRAPSAGAAASNPSGSQYNFSSLDSRVEEFENSGVSVAFLITDAPAWAEQPGGPASLEKQGAWKPSASAFGAVGAALARRYSGSYPDPRHLGQALPKVRYFQAWAEANFDIHLAPQWTRSNGRWVPTGPALYRSMLNAFYAGVKSVGASDVVITTGFGPYGDPPGGCSNQIEGSGCRMPPAMFARELMCLHGEALQLEACPDPPHFNVLAMDPYEISAPTTHAANADDVSTPDLGKLTRVVKRAVRFGRALPRATKPLWVTEFSYDSKPGNPYGLRLATQAKWLEEALYIFWRERVQTVVWYLLRDELPTYNPNAYYSGLYFYSGKPKPAFTAYRFPFVIMPTKHRDTLWGISPRSGTVTIQKRKAGHWVRVYKLRVRSGSVFVHTVSHSIPGKFRARVGGESSLTWSNR